LKAACDFKKTKSPMAQQVNQIRRSQNLEMGI